MKKKLLVLGTLLMFSAVGFAQKNYWKKTDSKIDSEIRESKVRITDFALFKLNISEIQNQLKNLPDSDLHLSQKGILMNFPNLEGGFDTYEIFESSTMHSDLQNRYADIRSYTGFKKGDKSTVLKFSIDPYFGLSGIIRNNQGIYYIDSYTKDNKVYKLYDRKNASSANPFECLFNGNSELDESALSAQKTVIDGLNRKYRLAITTTVEYTAYIAGQAGVGSGTDAQKKAAVLAAVNLAVTRLNEVFERDIAVRLQLIANTDSLFFISTDTFNTLDAGQMLNENITVTNTIIGAANYDIGHLFFQANAGNDNGLAATPSICGNSKAGGVTGSAVPVGDPFVIDYVAHEMGHQFGANHTQNNNCNRNTPTSIEPGSASSIMGYAGICAPNVQAHSDAYFHAVSIAEMYTRLTSGTTSNCGVKTPIANTEPIANAGPDKSIPKSTPFMLTATATDADNDPLTYTWEQTDFGVGTMPPQAVNAVGPLFRSVMPTASPSRYFPRLSTIVSGYDPAIVTPTDVRAWEKLASRGRDLNFSVLVRDNNPLGGQTGRDNVKLTVVDGAGPFLVTSQNTAGVVWSEGQSYAITWDVANTTAAPVSTPNVTILLSKDGGLTFPTVLVASTPNNGSYNYTVPGGLGTISNSARIMVKAVDNVFLNVNSQNFTINSSAVVVPGPNPGNPVITPTRIYQGLMIYPVPSNDGYVYIKADFPRQIPLRPYVITYEIFSMDGKLIVPKKTKYIFDQDLQQINLKHLPTESYMIHVTVDGEKIVKKLMMIPR
ncbi:Por secretion system C-terminal sorting domain-containing protein [Chryseobacterium shigense]|uniref:Por secretion system C-terminal sorting domain-containing protein n=1 Tax=Chryseobacterium shigense TaxID=297244 RepID=A0A1N7I667_9FLAO|nr:zinc-dependent metalloprotease family protein [Chryseobacterium shigense]SIS32558.1 Por secretion system C-terminal sorting domain-containing protein [Chryseobacterium shigense]